MTNTLNTKFRDVTCPHCKENYRLTFEDTASSHSELVEALTKAEDLLERVSQMWIASDIDHETRVLFKKLRDIIREEYFSKFNQAIRNATGGVE
jgi:hypothetical protein